MRIWKPDNHFRYHFSGATLWLFETGLSSAWNVPAGPVSALPVETMSTHCIGSGIAVGSSVAGQVFSPLNCLLLGLETDSSYVTWTGLEVTTYPRVPVLLLSVEITSCYHA